MLSRSERRQARRPLSEPAQLAAVVAAYRSAQAQLRALPHETPRDRNFAEGYAQALKDISVEADERLKSLGREELIDWMASSPGVRDDGLIPCIACKRKLTEQSARRAAEVMRFSLDEPGAREMVQAFWARAGAHSQARHEGQAA